MKPQPSGLKFCHTNILFITIRSIESQSDSRRPPFPTMADLSLTTQQQVNDMDNDNDMTEDFLLAMLCDYCFCCPFQRALWLEGFDWNAPSCWSLSSCAQHALPSLSYSTYTLSQYCRAEELFSTKIT